MANLIFFLVASRQLVLLSTLPKFPNFFCSQKKCTKSSPLVQALRLCTGSTAHRGSRGIALPFHDHRTRRWWGVSLTTRALFTLGKEAVPIVQEAGWAPGPVWTSAENLDSTGIRSPDRPARSQSLYRLSYPAHWKKKMYPTVILKYLISIYFSLFLSLGLKVQISLSNRRWMEASASYTWSVFVVFLYLFRHALIVPESRTWLVFFIHGVECCQCCEYIDFISLA